MREIVIPGDYLSDDAKIAGFGTYIEDDKIYAQTYGVLSRRRKISVIPLSGKYFPVTNDLVIGRIKDITYSNWIVDINSPYDALFHVSEYPKRIELHEMDRYMRLGNLIIAKIKDVDSNMKIELTMKDARKGILNNGRILMISPPKIPRVIGKGGSMINMLKKKCKVDLFVGQNGLIWIKGREETMDIVEDILFKIEKEAHTIGLTDRILRYIEQVMREND